MSLIELITAPAFWLINWFFSLCQLIPYDLSLPDSFDTGLTFAQGYLDEIGYFLPLHAVFQIIACYFALYFIRLIFRAFFLNMTIMYLVRRLIPFLR